MNEFLSINYFFIKDFFRLQGIVYFNYIFIFQVFADSTFVIIFHS